MRSIGNDSGRSDNDADISNKSSNSNNRCGSVAISAADPRRRASPPRLAAAPRGRRLALSRAMFSLITKNTFLELQDDAESMAANSRTRSRSCPPKFRALSSVTHRISVQFVRERPGVALVCAMGSMCVSEIPLVARVSSQSVSGPCFCESGFSKLHHLLSAETDIQYSQAKPTATPTKPGSRTSAQPGPRPPPPPTPTSSIPTRPNPVTHFSPAWPFSQADRLTGRLCSCLTTLQTTVTARSACALIPNAELEFSFVYIPEPGL